MKVSHTVFDPWSESIFASYFVVALCAEGDVRICPAGDGGCSYSESDDYVIDGHLSVGRVEVCIGGRYGTVCDDRWTHQDASVVCNQLGFSPYGELNCFSTSTLLYSNSLSGAIGLTDSEFSEGIKQEVINTIFCAGNESSVLDCPIFFEGLESCGQFEDAGIVCQGKLNRS